MTEISRRSIVVSAAAASAAFGLGRNIEFLPSAHAASGSGYFTFKAGDMEVTTLFDGFWEKPHDPGFVKNASVDEVKVALKAQGLNESNVTIPFTLTLVKMGDKVILFDAGTGGQLAPTAGKLGESMAAAGIDPKSITTVIVTHFHPDHIFGLMAKDTNAQIYPNAEIIVPEAEYAFWTDAAVFSKLPEANHDLAKRIQATLPVWQNVRRVEGDTEVLPGVVSISAHGHTPGHTVYALGSGKDQVMVLADTTNVPALFARHPGWHVAFDSDPVAAETMRRKLFDRVVADRAIMTGYHYGLPGAGTLVKDGDGYAFVPLA